MKLLILRLVITVSLPILIGVALVLIIFYQNLMDALYKWEQDSSSWINLTQQQILYNSLLSQQIISQYSFNQMQINMIVMNGLISKYNDGQIISNEKSQFVRCSYRELVFNECSNDLYKLISINELYVDLYFIRSVFKFELLTHEQQNFIVMNNVLSFYARASYLASLKEGLLVIKSIYNSDATSLLNPIPSTNKNVTNSQFEYCLGSDFIEPFDPRCRPWYIFSRQHKGYYFYEPYRDAVLGTLIMTLSSQVRKKNTFQSVNSIDFDMIDIVKSFDISQKENQYSVLFHEFNNTIFSHPSLLSDQTLISWQDLEFINIQDKNLSQIEYDKVLQEKNNFTQQIQKSIDFIKYGNYSIQQQVNLDKLLQQWTKFDVKYLSLIFPLRNQNTQFQNQEPYSYSIILMARVLKDESDRLQLFNLLDINYIKIPLIIEFILICLAVFVFIGNYGYFQIKQVQKPIEILIQFLKKSLQQQHQCQIQFYNKKDEKQTTLSNIQKLQPRKKNVSKNQQNNQSKFKNEDQTNTVFSPLNVDTPVQSTFNNLQLNLNNLICNDKNFDQQKTIQLFSKNNLLSRLNNDEPNIIDQLDSFATKTKRQRYYSQQNPRLISTKNTNQIFQNFDSDNDFTNLQKPNNVSSNKYNYPDSQISIRNHSQSQVSDDKKKEVDKDKILQGLKPLFLEMKIIKKTFQNLERLINHEIDSNTHNSEDNMNTLYHFAKAKSTFQRLQNEKGLSRCYFNLGIIYVLKNEYSLASQYFESSVQLNVTLLGIDSLKHIHENCFLNFEGDKDDWLIIFSKRIFAFAYCQKQIAFEMSYDRIEKCISKNFSTQSISQKYEDINVNQIEKISSILRKALDIFKVVENLFNYRNKCYSDIFQAFVYQEIIEILISLDQKFYSKQILDYLDKTKYFLNKIQVQKSKSSYKGIISLKEYKLSEDTQNMNVEDDLDYVSNQNLNHINQSYKSKQEIKNTMIDIMISRQKFILGNLERAKQQYLQAIEYFSQSLEEGIFFSPYLRKKTIFNLVELFEKLSFKQDFIDEQILNFQSSTNIDLTFLIQIDSIQNNYIYDQSLESFVKFKILQPGDRLKVLIFKQKLEEYVPFTLIQSDCHLNLVINTLQTQIKHYFLNNNDNNNNNSCANQLSWQSALVQSLQYIQEFNNQQLIDLSQACKKMKNQFSQSSSYEKLKRIQQEIKQKQQSLDKKNEKIIILFSNQQDVKQPLKIEKNILQLQKPIVFHLIDQFSQDTQNYQIQSKLFTYERLMDETQLVFRLKNIRGEKNNNDQKEFFTVINHF
ncbi:hypothetical protein ABPG74_018085 [Tetrahymena malaccensis]